MNFLALALSAFIAFDGAMHFFLMDKDERIYGVFRFIVSGVGFFFGVVA